MSQSPSMGEPTARQRAAELIKHRKGALRRYQLRERLRRDIDPADPVTTKLFQSLQLAAWAKNNSPDQDEAHAYERQCFEFLHAMAGTAGTPGTCRRSTCWASGKNKDALRPRADWQDNRNEGQLPPTLPPLTMR